MRPQLILAEGEETLSMSVCLPSYLIDTFNQGTDHHVSNVQDFSELVEETSHFIYLCWSGFNTSPVSLLDLELQADIDKCLMLWKIGFDWQEVDHFVHGNAQLRPEISEEEKLRYALSEKLCQAFFTDLTNGAPMKMSQEIHAQLKSFYRMSSPSRVRHLMRLL